MGLLLSVKNFIKEDNIYVYKEGAEWKKTK